MEDKKDFFYFVISAFSFFRSLLLLLFFFFALNTPPNGISCGWGKKLQVYSWVWTGCMARCNNGLMSCFHRILQGHNHDMIAFFKSDLSWTQTHHRRGRRMRVKSFSNTTVSCHHHGPLPARRMHTMLMQKLNLKWYASITLKKKKRLPNRNTQLQMFFG